ncbi:MAG: lipocalin family protein [Bacteroidales bacterium]|nr:lipocalin family protein [Bacteroidales bacterium]
MRKHVFLVLLVIGSAMIKAPNTNAQNQNGMIDKTVVKELDLQKYLGTWYEIARYNHRFERGLVGVTANYSIREDGKIKVLNSGYKKSLDGKFSQATGKAFIPNPDSEPGKLKVSFFWNFYGDYYVLELDENYQWAIIGSSSDKYLWILSRTPILAPGLYDELLEKIRSRGYDTSKLIRVEQRPLKKN